MTVRDLDIGRLPDAAERADLPDLSDVRAAAERIRPYAHRTPVLTSRSLNERLGAELFFKCENFQRAGAFKFRGACNAVFAAREDTLRNGVTTHSSGNHAAALTLAARLRSVPAVIVMPNNAAQVKRRAVEEYGGRIVFCEPNLVSRENALRAVVEREQPHVVHPYDNNYVIAGQGTAALELIEDAGPLDSIIAPVGGGGLLGGTAAAATLAPGTQIIGAEPLEADDAYRSLEAGRIIPVGEAKTIADGLRTSLGERNFALLRRHGVRIVTVSEDAIVQAMRLVWERMKVLIEPSAAVTVATLLEKRDQISGTRIGVIFSGGNIDLDKLPWNS